MGKKGITILLVLALIAVGMLTFIFSPAGQKILEPSPTPSPKPIESWLTNPSITPESMRGPVTASLEAELSPQNNSEITGQTTFKEINGKVFVGVELTNYTQGAEYPAFIHEGTCEEINGKIKYSLRPITDGKTLNYISKSMDKFRIEFPLSVRVHNPDSDLNQAIDNYISCADLQ